MSLTRDQIKAKKQPPQKVSVPEWEGDVYVRVMSAMERHQWHEDKRETNSQQLDTLLIRCICDEQGNRLFDDSDEAVAEVGGWDSNIHERIHLAALKVNKLDKEGREEMRKNSGTGQVSGS
jgi:hypothetical protein